MPPIVSGILFSLALGFVALPFRMPSRESARNGILDIERITREHTSILNTAGTWFYSKQDPGSILHDGLDHKKVFPVHFSLPQDAEQFQEYPVGSYILHITNIDSQNKEVIIYLRDHYLTFPTYIAARKKNVFSSIQNLTQIKPEGSYISKIADLPSDTDASLIIWIDSASKSKLLSAKTPLIGKRNAIFKLITYGRILDLLLVGAMFMLGFYHIAVHFLNERDDTPLWFGLLLIVVSLRLMLHGHYIDEDIPWVISHNAISRLDNIAYLIGIPLFITYLDTILYNKNLKITALISHLFILLSIVSLFLPPRIVSLIFNFAHIATIVILFWIIVRMHYIVILETRKGFRTLYMGIIILSISVINDIFMDHGLPSGGSMFYGGFLFFSLSQSYYTASRNADAYEKAMYLSSNLQDEVSAMTAELNNTATHLQLKADQRDDEIKIAHDIQKKILLTLPTETSGIRIDGFHRFLELLGGDYYDLMHSSDNVPVFIIADASGHGVPAALLTAMGRIAFADSVKLEDSPSKVLFNVNKRILESIKKEHYMTGLAIFVENDHVRISSASHQWPMIYEAKTKKAREVELTGGVFLGLFENSMQNFTDFALPFSEKDRLLLFTDGIVEQVSATGEIFGYERLIELLEKTGDLTLAEARRKIEREWEIFHSGKRLKDDATLILIERIENTDANSSGEEFT